MILEQAEDKIEENEGVVFSEIFSYLSQFMVGGTLRAVFDNICAYNAQQYHFNMDGG